MLNPDDSAWARIRIHEVLGRLEEAIGVIEDKWTRPSLLLKPRIFSSYRDGMLRWYAKLDEPPMPRGSTLCGEGLSPAEALSDFDAQYHKCVAEAKSETE